jgi:hypothetical protein
MSIKYCTHLIVRKDLQEHPNIIYVFGDNMARKGYGGQAKEMRGEPNSIGIPTKYYPTMSEESFFKDETIFDPVVMSAIDTALERIEEQLIYKCVVVIPAAGIGTGLAELPKRAPKIYKYITDKLEELGKKYGSYKV